MTYSPVEALKKEESLNPWTMIIRTRKHILSEEAQ
jgi:hypothetical protein